MFLFNALSYQKSDFQKNKSTELAVHSITSDIVKSFEDKENAFCISLDFAKAFDIIDHTILLKKLEYYGIRGSTFKWFKSDLTDRQQYAEINDTIDYELH